MSRAVPSSTIAAHDLTVARGRDELPLQAASEGAPTAAFVMFILVNGTLFMRPAEIVPALTGLPLYELCILGAIASAFPYLQRELTIGSLRQSAVTAAVIGILVAIVLSHLSNFSIYGARVGAVNFVKVLLYYLLLLATVNSPQRLRQLLFWLLVFTLAPTILAVMVYHEVLDLPALASTRETAYDDEGDDEAVVTVRLCGAGIFNNPNDLSRILVVGMIICMYFMDDRRGGIMRFLWSLPLGVLSYALTRTYSRGGFLALVAGLGVLFVARFGKWKAALAALVILPALLFAFGGRQTEISTSGGTGQARLKHWRDGLAELTAVPLFGIGEGEYPTVAAGYVAHNSFVHAYVELGLVGGTVFFALYYLPVMCCQRLGRPDMRIKDVELKRLRPYVMAIVVSYAVGMLSSSRVYTVPTYLLAGLGAVYVRVAGSQAGWPGPRVTGRLAAHVAIMSGMFFSVIYVYVRLKA